MGGDPNCAGPEADMQQSEFGKLLVTSEQAAPLISGIKPSKVLQVALVHMLGVPAFAWHNAKLESVLLGGFVGGIFSRFGPGRVHFGM